MSEQDLEVIQNLQKRLQRVTEERDVLRDILNDKHDPMEKALNEISEMCGCPEWDYAGQVVRDVKAALSSHLKREIDVSDLKKQLEQKRQAVKKLECVKQTAQTEGDEVTVFFRINAEKPSRDFLTRDHVSESWTGDDVRDGLSTVRSYDELVDYFVGVRGETSPCRAANMKGAYLLMLKGEQTGVGFDEEPLIRPTKIVLAKPVEETKFLQHLEEECSEYWEKNIRWTGDEWVEQIECEWCDGTGEMEEEEDEICTWCDGLGYEERAI